MSSTLSELTSLPSNTLLHPQQVLDAAGMDPELGLITITAGESPDDQWPGRGLWFHFNMVGLNDQGLPVFADMEFIEFTYSNFAEFIPAGELSNLIEWIKEKA